MTLTLELTPSQEKRLREKAAAAGQEPVAYLLAVADIDDAQEEVADVPPGSAYDLFKDLLDGWGSGGAVTLSENCREQFAEGMLEKRRQGHL